MSSDSATTPLCRLTPNSTDDAAAWGSAIRVGTLRIVISRDSDACWASTQVASRFRPKMMSANSTGQLSSTEYLEPAIIISWSRPASPLVSSSLAVGDSTQVAAWTSERTFSTRPAASANGVTEAAPMKPVMTKESVWKAMLVARAPTNANPL